MIPDDLSSILAQSDQAQASARDFAAQLGAFRKQLIIDGFAGEKAEDMAHGYMDALLDVVRLHAGQPTTD